MSEWVYLGRKKGKTESTKQAKQPAFFFPQSICLYVCVCVCVHFVYGRENEKTWRLKNEEAAAAAATAMVDCVELS